ncbi:hypothetical protein ACIPJ2_06630 [Curtobacterium sp. NPDC090217]|uniref:hypothetical protein n=1 Tax=Curtobacterium sp. NPDC090217 TaxID=3363970 RepID=UPI0038170ABF
MSPSSLGWSVFRADVGRAIPAERRRRMALVGVLTAVAAAAVLVVIGSVAPWPDLHHPSARVGAALLALASGAVGVAVVPFRPRAADGTRLYWSGSQMAAPDPIERYFRAKDAPTIDPGDRDDVLRDAEAVRAGMVPEVFRGLVLTAVAVLVFGALLLLDAAVVFPVWLGVISAGRTVANVIRLGKVERARALAATLPDVPSTPAKPGEYRRTPNGSKIRLPGD